MTSRRDVLVSFLGLAAANSCRRAPAPKVEARLVDQFLETGHLLRKGPPARASTTTRSLDVIIIGAGAAGLSAGWRLAATDLTFTVLELDDVLGGTARSGSNAISAFPWGAHYLPAPLTTQGPVPRLLKEMGVLVGVEADDVPRFDEAALIHEPEERLFYIGRWYEGLSPRAGASPSDVEQLNRFDAQMKTFAAARDSKGRKAFAVPIEHGSDEDEFTQLDRVSMAQWLETNGYTSPRVRWVVDYACRDDYGARAEDTSAWAAIWYFAARQTGDARNEGYLSWPEGNGRLIAQLARAVGEQRLSRHTLAHGIEQTVDGWFVHALDAKTKAPVRFHARHVICATPRFVAAHLVDAWRAAPPSILSAFQASPWVVANLSVNHAPYSRGFPLAWDNVIYSSRSLGYVVATHQRLRAESSGPTVLTWYYPLDGHDPKAEREKLLTTTANDWRDVALADLSPAHPGFADQVEAVDVLRWGHAMVRPTPGFLWGPHRRAAQEPVANSLHFAHSDLGGMALFEEANWHGVRAAEAVLSGLGQSAQTWL